MTYRANYRGLGQLLTSPEMQAAMHALAEKVEARAIAIAPDAQPYGEGYIASFEVDSGIKKGWTRRAFGRVRNTSGHAVYVEFGGGNTPKHRTLGKALDTLR